MLDSINYDPSVHGFEGPVNVSYSQYVFNQTANLFTALNELGIPMAPDPNSGDVAGASFMPVDIDPINQTRCSARTAYYDPYSSRPNLWISTGQTVTQILFEGFSGNANSTAPVSGDSSVGQGNPSNTGNYFGNASSPINTVHRKLELRNAGRGKMWMAVKRWLGLPTRQTTPSAPNTGLRAIGVEFAPDSSSSRRNVSATREVIISAGAIHSPQLLKLSGVGPAEELQSLQIPVAVDLPGVGTNLQDHYLVSVSYPYQNQSYMTSSRVAANATLMNQAEAEYYASRTGPWTSGPPDGDAFPPLLAITNGSSAIVDAASTQSATTFLVNNSDSTVTTGFNAQRQLLVNALRNSSRAAYELLNTNYGSFSVANMRPFSRGTITLKSSNPFQPPLIDPRYGSNPVDLEVLLAAILFNRQILATEAMQILQPKQLVPTLSADNDTIMGIIRKGIQTEYHPSCSCPMLPLSMGGVVDPNLLVYGTQNLRVVDASIMPMIPASHLQAVMYGIAEKVSRNQKCF